MGAQVLSARSTRRIAKSTGQPVVRAWSHGGYVMGFVTADHRHGWWHRRDGDWDWDGEDEVIHYSSCEKLFPGFSLLEAAGWSEDPPRPSPS